MSLDLSGMRIIELGGGTGLVGIVAARLGKSLIYICAIEILKMLTHEFLFMWWKQRGKQTFTDRNLLSK